MDTVELPRTGRTTTRAGFGCTALMTSLDERGSLRLLDAAYDAGIRHFDVAPIYGLGDAERCLGRFLGRHEDVTVTTKFGVPQPRRRPGTGVALALARGPVGALAQKAKGALRSGSSGAPSDDSPGEGPLPEEPLTTAWASASLTASLRNLAVERVDLFLLHEAGTSRLGDPALHGWLEGRVVAGDIGAFGIATQQHAAEALLVEHPELCDVVQTDWNVLDESPIPPGPFPIVFRSVGFVLGRVRRRLGAGEHSTGRLADLSRNPSLLGDVLVRAAYRQAVDGITLFSSKDPERIRGNAIAAVSDSLDPYVDALREHLA